MSDVLVLGGGIVGLLSALALTERKLKVTVLDASETIPPASWAGGGILSALYPWRYSDALTRLSIQGPEYYGDLVETLLDVDPHARELLHSGGLWIAVTPSQKAQAISWAARWEQKWASYSAREICHDCDDIDGMFFRQFGNIRNPRLLKALRHYLVRRGVTIEQVRVSAVTPLAAGGAQLQDTSGRVWRSQRVLLATGHHSHVFLRQQGWHMPLFPAKGEMLRYAPGALDLSATVLTEEGYLIPRSDGSVLVGSTLRRGDNTDYPTVSGRYQLEALAARLAPCLSALRPAQHWAGVRPGIEGDEPLIDQVPGCDGLFVATGHFRNGLVAAPGTANLVAELMCDVVPSIDPAPYSFSSLSSKSSFFKR